MDSERIEQALRNIARAIAEAREILDPIPTNALVPPSVMRLRNVINAFDVASAKVDGRLVPLDFTSHDGEHFTAQNRSANLSLETFVAMVSHHVTIAGADEPCAGAMVTEIFSGVERVCSVPLPLSLWSPDAPKRPVFPSRPGLDLTVRIKAAKGVSITLTALGRYT